MIEILIANDDGKDKQCYPPLLNIIVYTRKSMKSIKPGFGRIVILFGNKIIIILTVLLRRS